ncbi:hypothetical protein Tco_0158375 [Tanacetum coccineum]
MKAEALKEQTTASRRNQTVDGVSPNTPATLVHRITRAKHIEQTTALLTENKNLKAQIHENLKCITMNFVKSKVLAPGRYAIDVKPIPPHNMNNRKVHLDYLNILKKCRTLRAIVEELLEYGIGTCPKDFNKRDEKHATTTFTRKKQVTFEDQCETLNNNAHKHVQKLNIQKTNVPVLPSTGVNSCTDAADHSLGALQKNRISAGLKVLQITIEEHPRTNKFSLKNTNRVDDLSFSSKRMKLLLLLVTPKIDPSIRHCITKPIWSGDDKRMILPFFESLVLFVTLQMTTRILKNYNQQLILEFFVAFWAYGSCATQYKTAPMFLTPGQISSRLVPNPVPATPYVPPSNKELKVLFQPMFDEYLEPPRVERPVSPAPVVPVTVNSAGTPSSTTIDQDAPSPSHSLSSSTLQSPSSQQDVTTGSTIIEYNPFIPVDNDPFVNVFDPEPSSDASSSRDVILIESNHVTQPHHQLGK